MIPCIHSSARMPTGASRSSVESSRHRIASDRGTCKNANMLQALLAPLRQLSVQVQRAGPARPKRDWQHKILSEREQWVDMGGETMAPLGGVVGLRRQ